MEQSKALWQSKTIWVNFVMGIIGVVSIWVPQVSAKVTPEILMSVFAFINVILRLVTNKPIEFK